ncbi:MAG: MFS transporter [Hyphomicrobium sp.]|uniref:MFS transporter n=1 Tax=Hyphomicrobium sp. TaxID=82 RepID=UPI0039E38337
MSGASATYEQDSGHGHVSPGEIAVGVIIGRTSEFFDFFVYAIASVIVFPKLVFPYLDPLTGTLYSFAIFALAFIARPIGTVLFMALDRNYGRSVKLTITLFLLGTCTVAIAFLPGYESIGVASAVLLSIFRIGQGLALGGEWDGLPSLLAMNAPESRKGWYAMIPQLGAPLGLIVAAALFAFFASNLSSEDFLDWGWRYPFFVAFAINVVALFARLRMVDTPEYIEHFEQQDLEPKPIGETLKHEGVHVIIGAFAPLASFALFHMVTVFPLSWVFLYTQQSPSRFLVIEIIGAFVGLIAIVLSGYVADRVGRRNLLLATAGAIAVFSGFAPQLLNGGDIGEIVFMVIGFILLGLSFGQASGVVASSFAKIYRYTASALTTDLAWLVGAGFAPFVALWLSSNLGLMAAGGYLLSGAVCTLLALALSHQFESSDR